MANRSVVLSIDFESEFEGLGDDGSGVWQSVLTVAQLDRDSSFWVVNFLFPWGDYLSLEPVVVGSVKDRDYFYPEVFSRADLELIGYGFYFDTLDQILYVRIDKGHHWWTRPAFDYGESRRFIDHAQVMTENNLPIQAYIDGVFCEPRLIGEGLSYKNSADKIENNRMDFNTCNGALINSDGELDAARSQTIGRGMRLFLGISESDEPFTSITQYEEVFNGVVSVVAFPNGQIVNFQGDDPRKYWEETLNPGIMTLTEFPDMDPNLEGISKPTLAGAVRKIPLINVSAEASGAAESRTFYIGSASVGIAVTSEVYEGDDPAPYVGAWTQTPGTNLIVFDQKKDEKMYADVSGPNIISPVTGLPSIRIVDIVLYLLDTYANLPYLSTFFDTDSISKIQARSPDASIYVPEPMKLKEAIDLLLSSANTRIYQRGLASAGDPIRQVYSMIDLNIEGFEPSVNDATIDPTEALVLPMAWSFDEETFMSTIKVEYNKDYRSEIFRQLVLNDKELEALNNHPIPRQYSYVAYLSDETEVETLAQERYDQAILIPYRLEGRNANKLDFDLLDYVFYTHQRDDGQWILNPAIWRVIEVDKLQQTYVLALYEESVPVVISQVSGMMYGPIGGMYLDNNLSMYGDMQVDSKIEYIFGGS